MPEECVYDQTKLVVLSEQYRELTLNPRFHEFATTAGFRIYACEGYDPESKGKVEAGVKYVKQDGLYGEEFASEQDLRSEEHTSELQSLMRISYAVFCLKKKIKIEHDYTNITQSKYKTHDDDDTDKHT